MATQQRGSMNFWQKLRSGPWAKPVVERIELALDDIVRRLRASEAIGALVVFGSYARGDFGRKSDLDLLILLREKKPGSLPAARRWVIDVIGEIESASRLPIHIAPLVADAGDPEALGPALLHDLQTDGIILYGEASTLASLQPSGLTPWNVTRFSLAGTSPRDRVRLARRLHGTNGKPGIIRLPGLFLGRGAALVPASQAQAARNALEDAGANFDLIPVWREV